MAITTGCLEPVADKSGGDFLFVKKKKEQDTFFPDIGRCPLWVTSRLHGHCVDTSAPRAEADVIGGKADVEIEGLLSDRERTFSRQAQKVRL